MRQPFPLIRSTAAVLHRDDVDTDQVIPARFLKTTVRTGLGRHLFADWRYDSAGGEVVDFALNTKQARTSQILIAGRNFGCGSSREHAPWALADFGFRVIVARSFADIFRANALKNALLPVALEPSQHEHLVRLLSVAPAREVIVDLMTCTIAVDGETAWTFDVPAFSRRCLLDGVDPMGFLLGADDEITAWERAHPAVVSARA